MTNFLSLGWIPRSGTAGSPWQFYVSFPRSRSTVSPAALPHVTSPSPQRPSPPAASRARGCRFLHVAANTRCCPFWKKENSITILVGEKRRLDAVLICIRHYLNKPKLRKNFPGRATFRNFRKNGIQSCTLGLSAGQMVNG